MAKLIINQTEYTLPDGASMADVCEQAGLPFNCNTGICGSCQITILEGHDNLNELTEEEHDLGLSGNSRLACQCRIIAGTVRITF